MSRAFVTYVGAGIESELHDSEGQATLPHVVEGDFDLVETGSTTATLLTRNVNKWTMEITVPDSTALYYSPVRHIESNESGGEALSNNDPVLDRQISPLEKAALVAVELLTRFKLWVDEVVDEINLVTDVDEGEVPEWNQYIGDLSAGLNSISDKILDLSTNCEDNRNESFFYSLVCLQECMESIGEIHQTQQSTDTVAKRINKLKGSLEAAQWSLKSFLEHSGTQDCDIVKGQPTLLDAQVKHAQDDYRQAMSELREVSAKWEIKGRENWEAAEKDERRRDFRIARKTFLKALQLAFLSPTTWQNSEASSAEGSPKAEYLEEARKLKTILSVGDTWRFRIARHHLRAKQSSLL